MLDVRRRQSRWTPRAVESEQQIGPLLVCSDLIASQGYRFFSAVQLEVIVHVFSHGLLKNGQPPSAGLGWLRVVGLHSLTCRIDAVSLLARPFPKVLERDAIIKRQVVPLAESEELKNVPAVVWSRAVSEDFMNTRAMLGYGGGRGQEPAIT